MTTIYDYLRELDESGDRVSPLAYVVLNCEG